ncbi:Glu-tRNA(Gln) amidotransferase subunit GatE [archaeon]|jgi:Glu-tRNA(Gln) amidotransferase subunit E-like FAD-binding protein|nr:Glu-tRNA(Gln) amidotransferase subunit GatE [archaeon]
MDYKKLGFKCGIECHQQLDGRKLFCNCPCIVHDKEPTVFFERKIRAIAGESGKTDKAAKTEMKKDKVFKYQARETSSCLVEYDEEPPHAVNPQALETALEVALLLNMKPVDEVQFMRKTIVDGSNVSAFQRTALVAVGGYIETTQGRVGIDGLMLEEEAAKKVKEEKNEVTYDLARLGVPLLEIATAPDIQNATHAKEVAEKIGMILRSTGKAKRGIGTIRQDVNVSIKGHSRVELKGFQELKFMEKIVEDEVKRQVKTKGEDKHVRKLNPDKTTSFMRPMPSAARMYPETDIPTIPITKDMLLKIKLPELLDEKTLRYEKKYKLRPELAREIVKTGVILKNYTKLKLDNNFIADVLINYPKEIKKRFNLESKLSEKDFLEVLTYLEQGKISKDAVLDLLVKKVKGQKINLKSFETIDDKTLEKEIKKIVKANPKAPIGGLMGDVMKKFKGKVDGQKAMSILKKLL